MFDHPRLWLLPVGLSAFALAWIHLTKQKPVARNLRTSVVVVLKTFLLCAILIYFLVRMCGCSETFVFTRCYPFVLLMLLVARYDFEEPFADSALGTAFIWAVFLPFYLAKQFVLGFHDKERWLLAPPDRSQADVEKAKHEDGLVGEKGFVTAVLRPMGEVKICEQTYQAKSNSRRLGR